MRRLRAACLLAMLPAGCASGPLLDNPTLLGGPVALENGAQVPPADAYVGKSYPEVFDEVLDAVSDYFPIAYANRYEGRILGKPTLAPGFEQPLRRGSPDFYDRVLASFQAYRYRCEIRIREADPAGYYVQVIVRKELKDYPAPSGLFTAVPLFGDVATVDRDQFVLVRPDITTPANDPSDRWIPKGRETAIEQAILKRLQGGH
jgi:hypothetical protein